MSIPDGRRRHSTWLGWLLFAILAAVNLLVLRQHNHVLEQLGAVNGAEVADKFVAVAGVTPDGRYSRIDLNVGRQHLVFTYARNCRYCQATLPEWKRMASELDRSQWSVIWLSRDSVDATRAFVSDHAIKDAVLAEVPYRTYAQAGLARVPRTIVIGADGEVTGSILGALDSSNRQALESLIATPLENTARSLFSSPVGR